MDGQVGGGGDAPGGQGLEDYGSLEAAEVGAHLRVDGRIAHCGGLFYGLNWEVVFFLPLLGEWGEFLFGELEGLAPDHHDVLAQGFVILELGDAVVEAGVVAGEEEARAEGGDG